MFGPVVFLLAALAADASRCEGLRPLALPNATVTSAAWVAAGPFAPPAQPGGPPPPPGQTSAPPLELPAHCRVQVVMKPSTDSHIEMEVWLPADWNGKFQAVGNGGWAGIISYPAMARALQERYATASTDTGHKGSNALFAIGHPEKLIDFGYRVVHEMAVQSKAIIASYYQRAARLAYWNGCSTGGRQGLMSAQRYPEDFDAIIAGAPANYHSHLHATGLSLAASLSKDPSGILPPAKLALVTQAVLDACDARDSISDRLLTDSTCVNVRCHAPSVRGVVGNRVDMTRPLCPYPQVAHYTGVGSTNDAANFVCQPR